MVHFAGDGILIETLSMYAFILSKCFSQKCWIVSLIGKGSNTLILWLAKELWLEFSRVTLVLFGRRDTTVTGLLTLTLPTIGLLRAYFLNVLTLPLPIVEVIGARWELEESKTLLDPTEIVWVAPLLALVLRTETWPLDIGPVYTELTVTELGCCGDVIGSGVIVT